MRHIRRFLTIALAASMALFFWPTDAHADEDSPWRIDRYEVHATLDDQGQTRVRLDFDFNFAGEPGHGPFVFLPERQEVPDDPDLWRDIPVSDVSASSSTGAPADLATERSNGAVELRVGDPNVTVDGVQQYTIEYTVDGLPNPRAGGQELDQLGWNVIGPQWEVPISDVSVTVDGPGEVTGANCFAGGLNSSQSCTSADASGATATFTQDHLDPGEGLTIAADYPVGTLPESAQSFSRRQTFWNTFEPGPVGLIGGGATAVLSFFGVRAFSRRRADKEYQGITPGTVPRQGEKVAVGPRRTKEAPVRFSPPDERNPGMLGTLVDGSVDNKDITATIIDLAVRGHLKVENEGANYRFHLTSPTPNSDKLLPHEDQIMRAMFASGTTFALDKVSKNKSRAQRFTEAIQKAHGLLYSAAVNRGWFSGNPQTTKAGLAVLGMVIAVGGGIAAAALLGPFGWGLIAIPVIIAGLAVAWQGVRLNGRTADGTAMQIQLEGFRQYLTKAEAHQLKWEEGEDIFSKYLPYAIIFDCADRWTKIFDDLREQGLYDVQPSWYYSPHGHASMMGLGYGLSSMSTGLSSAMTTAMASAATSASAGSGGGIAGGVGGGVGGGGGGGW